jgi:hypothetical protein
MRMGMELPWRRRRAHGKEDGEELPWRRKRAHKEERADGRRM